MPLEETNVIDEILEPNGERRIGLVIVDSGAVTDPARRLDLLRRKCEHYLEAALEGCVLPGYRYTDPNDFYIQVVCDRRPTEQMLRIDHVAREGDTKHRLRVDYTESQEGIWTARAAEPAVEPFVVLDRVASNNLDGIITAAFDAGYKTLQTGEMPLLLLFVKGVQTCLYPLQGFDSHERVISGLTEWAAENADVRTCVFVFFTTLKNGAEDTPALAARVFQRGPKQAMTVAQELSEDIDGYHFRGRLLFLGCCQNILATPS